MPELTVKEIRVPELHLPELKRDGIVRALTEIGVPDVDRPKDALVLPDRSRLALRVVDIGTALAGAVRAARFVAPVARRRRWPIAIGIVALLGIIAVALLRTPAVREGTERAARLARERVDAMRASTEDEATEAAESLPIAVRASDVDEVLTAATPV